MNFVIWNKIEPAKIDVIITEQTLQVIINNVVYWSKTIEHSFTELYSDILNDIEKINEAYIRENEEEFKELSNEFLEKLKTL